MKVDLYHDHHHKLSWHRASQQRELVKGDKDQLEDIVEELTEEIFDGHLWHGDSKMQILKASVTHFYKHQRQEVDPNLKHLDSDAMVQGIATDTDLIETDPTVQVADVIPQVIEYDDIVDGVVVSYAEVLEEHVNSTDEITFEAVCTQVTEYEEVLATDGQQPAEAIVEESVQLAIVDDANDKITYEVNDGSSMSTSALQKRLQAANHTANLDGTLNKKKTTRGVSSIEFCPYSDFFGGRRGDQPLDRREDRKVQRLVSLAKMHCVNRTFCQRPHTNHVNYVQSLGLFYASQPILTTPDKTEPVPMSPRSVTRPSRKMEVPANFASQFATKEKNMNRQRLLARRLPWLWHFPSPRSFGKIAHEPFIADEQPHDAPTVNNEFNVKRILI